jgi:hypothetical protein
LVKTLDIIDAIQAAAAEISEIGVIYIDLVPKDFARPSLLIETAKIFEEPANCQTVRRTEEFILTVFSEINEFSNAETRRLLELQDDVLNLFRAGFLPVKDRNLGIKTGIGRRDWGMASITLNFEYFDIKDETPDNTPPVETVETEVAVKNS